MTTEESPRLPEKNPFESGEDVVSGTKKEVGLDSEGNEIDEEAFMAELEAVEKDNDPSEILLLRNILLAILKGLLLFGIIGFIVWLIWGGSISFPSFGSGSKKSNIQQSSTKKLSTLDIQKSQDSIANTGIKKYVEVTEENRKKKEQKSDKKSFWSRVKGWFSKKKPDTANSSNSTIVTKGGPKSQNSNDASLNSNERDQQNQKKTSNHVVGKSEKSDHSSNNTNNPSDTERSSSLSGTNGLNRTSDELTIGSTHNELVPSVDGLTTSGGENEPGGNQQLVARIRSINDGQGLMNGGNKGGVYIDGDSGGSSFFEGSRSFGVHAIYGMVQTSEKLAIQQYKSSEDLVGQTIMWLQDTKRFSELSASQIISQNSANDRVEKLSQKLEEGDRLLSNAKSLRISLQKEINFWSLRLEQNKFQETASKKNYQDSLSKLDALNTAQRTINLAKARNDIADSQTYLSLYSSLLKNLDNFERLLRSKSLPVYTP